ncbi:unnamed protein product [Amoebophrya sp. A120]|nr:unnamed protein product [Amoebophrya sp. A120]|eukprot:GSA120T00014800001.1
MAVVPDHRGGIRLRSGSTIRRPTASLVAGGAPNKGRLFALAIVVCCLGCTSMMSPVFGLELESQATSSTAPTVSDAQDLAFALKATTLDTYIAALVSHPNLSKIAVYEPVLISKAKALGASVEAYQRFLKLMTTVGWDSSKIPDYADKEDDIVAQLKQLHIAAGKKNGTGNHTGEEIMVHASDLNRYYTYRLNQELLKLKTNEPTTAAALLTNISHFKSATGASILWNDEYNWQVSTQPVLEHVYDENTTTYSDLIAHFPLYSFDASNSDTAQGSTVSIDGVASVLTASGSATRDANGTDESTSQLSAVHAQGSPYRRNDIENILGNKVPPGLQRNSLFGTDVNAMDLFSPTTFSTAVKEIIFGSTATSGDEDNSASGSYTSLLYSMPQNVSTSILAGENQLSPNTATSRALLCDAELSRWTSLLKRTDYGAGATSSALAQHKTSVRAQKIQAMCSCAPMSADNTALVPVNTPCPEECGFEIPSDDSPCYKICVRPDQCGDFDRLRSFANPQSRKCEVPCGRAVIPGCVECDVTSTRKWTILGENSTSGATSVAGQTPPQDEPFYLHKCHRCDTGMALSGNGSVCENRLIHKIVLIEYVFILVIVTVSALYLLLLFLRKTVNSVENTWAAYVYKQCCRPQKVLGNWGRLRSDVLVAGSRTSGSPARGGRSPSPPSGSRNNKNLSPLVAAKSSDKAKKTHEDDKQLDGGTEKSTTSPPGSPAEKKIKAVTAASTSTNDHDDEDDFPERHSAFFPVLWRVFPSPTDVGPGHYFFFAFHRMVLVVALALALQVCGTRVYFYGTASLYSDQMQSFVLFRGSSHAEGDFVTKDTGTGTSDKNTTTGTSSANTTSSSTSGSTSVVPSAAMSGAATGGVLTPARPGLLQLELKCGKIYEEDGIRDDELLFHNTQSAYFSSWAAAAGASKSATSSSFLEINKKSVATRNSGTTEVESRDHDSTIPGGGTKSRLLRTSTASRSSASTPEERLIFDDQAGRGRDRVVDQQDHLLRTAAADPVGFLRQQFTSFFQMSMSSVEQEKGRRERRGGRRNRSSGSSSSRKNTSVLSEDATTLEEAEASADRMFEAEQSKQWKQTKVEQVMAGGLLGVYFGAMLLTFWYYLSCLRIGHACDSLLPSPRQFCLVASNFPQGTDALAVQKWLLQWNPNLQIIGCSLRYTLPQSFQNHQNRAVLKMLEEHTHNLDEKRKLQYLNTDGLALSGLSSRATGRNRDSFLDKSLRKLPPLKPIDCLLGYGPNSNKLVPIFDKLSTRDEQYVFKMLLKARMHGTCYITFGTRDMRDLVLANNNHEKTKPPKFLNKYEISLEPAMTDPEMINWDIEFKVTRLVFAFISLLLLTITYMIISLPNLYLNLVYARTPGIEMPMLTDWIAGLVPAVGAMQLIRVGGNIFDSVGFTSGETRNLVFFVVTYFAVIAMLMFDFLCMWIASQGKIEDMVYETQSAAYENDGYSVVATNSAGTPRTESQQVDALLAMEVWELLFPFSVSVLLFDLLFDILLPNYIAKHVIRSRSFSKMSAERLIMPARFDYPSKYVTLLVTVFAFVIWLRLDVDYVCFLSVFLVLVLVLHYYLCLLATNRLYAKTSITSNSSCKIAFLLWGFCLFQILYVAAIFGDRVGYLDLQEVKFLLVLVHFGLYFLTLYNMEIWNEPKDESGGSIQATEPLLYEEMLQRRALHGESATYFNCNHVSCLRSKYLRDNCDDKNGLYKIYEIESSAKLTKYEKKEEAKRHLDYLWYSRREAGMGYGMGSATTGMKNHACVHGAFGVITPYVPGYDHLQPHMPSKYVSAPVPELFR